WLLSISTVSFFFFMSSSTTLIYSLSLHDALPISVHDFTESRVIRVRFYRIDIPEFEKASCTTYAIKGIILIYDLMNIFSFFGIIDRKSTRLNSSHVSISYAVFCLKKKHNKTADGI